MYYIIAANRKYRLSYDPTVRPPDSVAAAAAAGAAGY
jgi:hypothetical protein